MTLGVFDDVRVNSRRVMQVKLSGIDVPEGTALYVRGGALDRFDGKDWTRSRYDFPYDYLGRPVWSRDGRALYEASGAGYAVPDGARGRPFATAEFFVYPMATSVIFSIGDPTKVEGDVVLPTFDLCGTAYSSSNFESGGRYVVTSSSPDIRIDDIVHGHEEVLSKLYLGIPSGRDMDEVKRLAKEVAGKARGPVAKARAIERYFRDGFVYSYLGKHGRQSISEFLTESRAANCEYFATAMAMMLRAEGVPARLAIGYLSTERRQVGDYFDVRNSDGHAWVEAYIPGRGWVAYDPTPDVVGFPEEGFILGREAYLYYLNLQMSWYRYVIGYDFYVQQDVLASIVAVWRDIAAAIAIAVMAVVAAWLAAIIAIGRIRRRRGGAATGSEAAVEWLEAEKLLSKFGFLRRRWQTPLEFASEVAEREPGLAAVGEVARAYYVWRYGEGGGEKMSGSVKHLKAALRRHGERTVGRRSGFSKR